jgi:hypothetical protein
LRTCRILRDVVVDVTERYVRERDLEAESCSRLGLSPQSFEDQVLREEAICGAFVRRMSSHGGRLELGAAGRPAEVSDAPEEAGVKALMMVARAVHWSIHFLFDLVSSRTEYSSRPPATRRCGLRILAACFDNAP